MKGEGGRGEGDLDIHFFLNNHPSFSEMAEDGHLDDLLLSTPFRFRFQSQQLDYARVDEFAREHCNADSSDPRIAAICRFLPRTRGWVTSDGIGYFLDVLYKTYEADGLLPAFTDVADAGFFDVLRRILTMPRVTISDVRSEMDTLTKMAFVFSRKPLRRYDPWQPPDVFSDAVSFRLLVPINAGNSHWYMVEIQFSTRTFVVYDSQIKEFAYYEPIQKMLLIFVQQLEGVLRMEGGDVAEWTERMEIERGRELWILTIADCFQQHDGYNCGILLCLNLMARLQHQQPMGFGAQPGSTIKQQMTIVRYALSFMLIAEESVFTCLPG